MKENNEHYNAIEKVLKILMDFVPNNDDIGTIELSKKLGFHKATVNRALHVLAKHEFLWQDPHTKKFRLGRAAVMLGRAATESLNSRMVAITQPFLNNLRDIVKETVILEVISGDSIVLAYRAIGPQAVQVTFRLGDRIPVHVSAGARAILAFYPSETVDELLKSEQMVRYTKNTITDIETFKQILKEVQAQKVAFYYGERSLDVNAISAPVFNHNNRAVAAVVIAGPAYRMKHEINSDVVVQLKKTASEISKQLLHDEA